MLRRLMLIGALCVVLLRLSPPMSVEAQTLVSLRLPFAAGTSWKVLQGYNGGTHVPGPERYALDLVRDDGGATAGADVLAPASGSVWWMNPPGTGNGCLLIKLDGGNGIIVTLCHIFARPFRRDERIEAGQHLGTIGPAGTVGNNGAAHLHLSLHRTNDYGVTRLPVPFAPPDGLVLEGQMLPPDGSYNQYVCPGRSCRSGLVSSNAPGVAPVVAPAGASAATVAPAPPIASPAVSAGGVPLRPGVVARITGAGAGDCVNVREAPGLRARVERCLGDGHAVIIGMGPLPADGRFWWQLQGQGWAVGDYLYGVTAPTPALRIGGTAVIDAGVGDCLNLRESPGLSAPVLACLPSGARLSVSAGPREADGHVWWQLDGRGWVAAGYLDPHDA